MKKTPVAVLAASILLSACGGGAKPDPSSSTSSPTTSSSAQTTSVSPTTAGPTIDPNIPAAARVNTPAGAAAFVKYFHDQLNVSWRTPRAGLLPPLSLPDCKTCTALDDNAADIPGSLKSSGSCCEVGPGGVFVVAGVGLQAAVQDADEAVGQLS